MNEKVSTVPPDFVETMKSVRFRSSRSVRVRSVPGSVLSSTARSRKPSAVPKTFRSTSGARLEPPIPSSSAKLKPSARTPSTKEAISARRPCIAHGLSSQPRRSAISFGSGFQRVWSFRRIRSTTRPAASALRASPAAVRQNSGCNVIVVIMTVPLFITIDLRANPEKTPDMEFFYHKKGCPYRSFFWDAPKMVSSEISCAIGERSIIAGGHRAPGPRSSAGPLRRDARKWSGSCRSSFRWRQRRRSVPACPEDSPHDRRR